MTASRSCPRSVSGETPSTKAALASLAAVSSAKNVLVVADSTDTVTWLSLRNLSTVHLIEPGQLNTYDVLVSDDVVFIKSAFDAFVARPAKGKSAKAWPTTRPAHGDAETEPTSGDRLSRSRRTARDGQPLEGRRPPRRRRRPRRPPASRAEPRPGRPTPGKPTPRPHTETSPGEEGGGRRAKGQPREAGRREGAPVEGRGFG